MNGTSSLSSLGRDIFNRLKLGDACSNLDGEVKQNCLKAREFEAEQQAVLEEAANTHYVEAITEHERRRLKNQQKKIKMREENE